RLAPRTVSGRHRSSFTPDSRVRTAIGDPEAGGSIHTELDCGGVAGANRSRITTSALFRGSYFAVASKEASTWGFAAIKGRNAADWSEYTATRKVFSAGSSITARSSCGKASRLSRRASKYPA